MHFLIKNTNLYYDNFILEYIEQYKNGEDLFDIPLDEVVQQKYQLYLQACQALGGVAASPVIPYSTEQW